MNSKIKLKKHIPQFLDHNEQLFSFLEYYFRDSFQSEQNSRNIQSFFKGKG